MMKLKITGANWSKQALLHSAATFFAVKLKIYKPRVRIKIELVSGLKCQGEAHQNSRLSFRIKLDTLLKPIRLVKCLAHELVHVQQWLSGQMEDVDPCRRRVRWGKRNYYSGVLAYRKHPWEIQAHRVEKDLWNSWIELWN